jgi:hypothetical protein
MRSPLAFLLIIFVLLCTPRAGSADPADAIAQIGATIAHFVEYLMNRSDKTREDAVRNSVPNLVTALIRLSSEKENLADLLDRAAQTNGKDDALARSIEESSQDIVGSLNNLKTLIDSIDPNWTIEHPEMFKAAVDLRLEKIRVYDQIVTGGIGGHAGRLGPIEASELSAALRSEAKKLDEEAKALAQVAKRPSS